MCEPVPQAGNSFRADYPDGSVGDYSTCRSSEARKGRRVDRGFIFREAVPTIASYHWASGDRHGAIELLRQVIDNPEHDEDTRFILAATLRDFLRD